MPEKPHQPDYVLYFTVVILCAVGVITAYSAGSDMAISAHESPSHFAVRQLGFAVVGLGLMALVMRIHPRTWYRWAPPVMLINLFLLCIVKVIGHSSGGGKRWLGSTSIHIQPSELAMVSIAMYLAFFFTKKLTLLHSLKQGFIPAVVVTVINALLIFIEPDMGTAMTLVGTAVILMIAAGTRLRRIVALGTLSIPVLAYAAFFSHSYRSGRILAFLEPFSHTDTTSYQLLAGWTAMANGGWFGRGYGMSLAKTGYLPEANTDFVFPVFVEEWGYIGAIALMAALGILVWRGFIVARHAPNRFMALFAVGLTSAIAMGSLINLGAVTGLLPVTGIPLPFITYGGTDLVVNLVSMGMLLGISRYTLDEEPEADELAEVIEVEDSLWATPKKAKIANLPNAAKPAVQAPVAKARKSADVRPLRPAAGRRSTGTATHQGWRSKQEAAATSPRVASKQTSGLQRTTVAQAGTWRERQHKADSWREKPTAGKRSSLNKRPSDRRER